MSAKFDFRLQPLLQRRKRIEDEKRRDFAACRRVRDEGRCELERLSDESRRSVEQLVTSACMRPAAELRLRDAHLRSLEAAIDDQHRRLREYEASCESAREALISASQERRVMERLKERWRRAFEADEGRREALELDEANARRHDHAARTRLVLDRAGRAAP